MRDSDSHPPFKRDVWTYRRLSAALRLFARYTLTRSTLLLCVFIGLNSNAETLRLPIETNEPALADKLLVEAIKRGGKYNYTVPYTSTKATPLRKILKDFENNDLDLYATMSNAELEKRFQAIYIPVNRGLLGMRLAIVKQEKQALFAKVKTASDLKKFTAGQGTFWTDSDILESNALPVVREEKYPNLFRMLEADRFDYFPRGLQEPWNEVSRNSDLKLTVDQNILLWYTAPYYFFVKKENQALANHITEQLEEMIKDGTYDKLFFGDPEIKAALEKAKLSSRRIIKLENPYLTPETPTNRPELWFDPFEYQNNNSLAGSKL